MEKGTLANPVSIDVPVGGGVHTLVIRPWNMALHDQCFPVVVELLEHWMNSQKEGEAPTSLGAIVTTYKEEVTRLCRLTVDPQLQKLGLDWGEDLLGEDLYGIAQAVWDTSLYRPGGGGVLGKAMSLLAPLFMNQLQGVKRLDTSTPNSKLPPPNQATSQPKTPTSSPPDSLSSQDGGEPPLSSSVMS